MFGESKRVQLIFKTVFCFFLALGCMIQLQAVLDFSDSMTFLIALPNVLGLYLFAPEVKKEINAYLEKLIAEKVAR